MNDVETLVISKAVLDKVINTLVTSMTYAQVAPLVDELKADLQANNMPSGDQEVEADK